MTNESIELFPDIDSGSLGLHGQLNDENDPEYFLNDFYANPQLISPLTSALGSIVGQSTGTSEGRPSLSLPFSNFFVDSESMEFMFDPMSGLKTIQSCSTTAAGQANPLEQESLPRKRLKLGLMPDQQRLTSRSSSCRDRYRQMLFPALNLQSGQVSKALFSPHLSLLTSILSETSIGTATRQRTTQIVTNILLERCQSSLPASWVSQVLESNTESTFDCFTLPLRSLILREWSTTLDKLCLDVRNFDTDSSHPESFEEPWG
jgi:hypothetical protein